MSYESNFTGQTRLIKALRELKSIAEGCLRELGGPSAVGRPTTKLARGERVQVKRTLTADHFSFSTNRLAFVKRHARGRSGHQKFTLLLAYLAKGDISQRVASAVVKKQWNKMKGVLGGKYNGAYANRAMAEGWVDSPKHGVYTLSASWKDALADNG